MNVYLITAAVIAVALILLWLLSLKLKDASIVDIFWGLGFVLIATTSYRLADGFADRKLLLTVLVVVWGGRLAGYLARRNIGKGEDYRYQAMRRRHGDRFPLVSLFLVFGLQGVLMWIISLPLQAAQMAPQPDRLTPLDWLGVLLWGVGFLFETIGDRQLSRFKADPANRGKVMDRGLWAYTRHPNYFGDAVLWWGYFLIAAAAGAWWTIVSPVVMTLLLMKVSGVALLEKTLVKTKPEYQDYVRRTSAFVPWFPRS
jgi:steroid 5-alpha reductase family enzyme